MLTVWKSLIQSKLDYCSQLWSPSDQANISKLEGVARNFTSRVAGIDWMDYRSSSSGNSPRGWCKNTTYPSIRVIGEACL